MVAKPWKKWTYISPAIVPGIDVQCLQVVGPLAVRAVLAARRARQINHVSGTGRQEITHVLPTGGIRRQRNAGQLALQARHLGVPGHGRNQGPHEVVEWVEVVQPVPPEHLYLAVGYEDAGKGNEAAADEHGVGQRGEELVRAVGCYGLADGGVEELVDWCGKRGTFGQRAGLGQEGGRG